MLTGGSGISVWRLRRCHLLGPFLCWCLPEDTWSWSPPPGTGVTGFYSIPCCCCTRTAPPLALCVCVPLHIGLFKHCGVVGRAGPMRGGEHRASPQALGNILGAGVRQMRSAVPSVGYRNWVVLKEMLYKGLKLAGWKKKSAKYSRLSVDTSRLPPEGEGSLIIVF